MAIQEDGPNGITRKSPSVMDEPSSINRRSDEYLRFSHLYIHRLCGGLRHFQKGVTFVECDISHAGSLRTQHRCHMKRLLRKSLSQISLCCTTQQGSTSTSTQINREAHRRLPISLLVPLLNSESLLCSAPSPSQRYVPDSGRCQAARTRHGEHQEADPSSE